MEKIKENLAIFFIVWGVILFLNQVIIFRSCFAPQCLIAALPHTSIITFLLFILILKSDKEEKTDIGNIDIPNIKIELDDKKVVQPVEINNLFLFETKELQDEIKVESKTQISTKLNIRDISYPLNVPFKVIVKDIKNVVLCINIDNQEYLISKPKNNTWENISLKNEDILIVEKVSYGSKEKSLVKLNLLEINGKKNELKNNNNVTIFGENELLILKKQLEKLEVIFQKLIEQKTEYLNDIEEFNNQHNIHLGELIRNILNLKKEILYKKIIKHQKIKEQFEKDKDICDETKQTINELKNTIVELEEILENIDEDNESYEEIKNAYDELKEELKNIEEQLLVEEQELEKTKEKIEEDEIFQEEYEEAKSNYEEFDNEYKHIKDIQKDVKKLNEEDKKELKLLYKKAAKLCHPDIVSDEFKEKAHEIMQLLNDAYSKKDIHEVRKILLDLENGITFKTISNVINNKELLESKIEEFEKNIIDLEKEINIIKEDDTYKIIATLENWDEYFEELKNELQKEKNILEDEAKSVLGNQNIIENWILKLWDWADENNISDYKWINVSWWENNGDYIGIPRQKNSLVNLTNLIFYNDKISLLSDEICKLTNLKYINLFDNHFLKKLPNNIGNLYNLEELQLAGNQLDFLPESLFYLKKLKILSLGHYGEIESYGNCLLKIAEEIEELENLEELYLDFNELKEITKKIGNLKNLTTLSLAENKLVEIPEEIGKLRNLKQLYLHSNELKFLPQNIIQLKNLNYMNLCWNEDLILTNEQKLWIKELEKKGSKIYYDEDLFAKINEKLYVEEVEEWIQILWNWADENGVDSNYCIPREKNKLLELTTLYLFDPWELDPDDAPLFLRNNLPKEIGYITSLIELHLYVGNISELPNELGNLKNLKNLIINIDSVFEEEFYIDMGYTIRNINNLPERIIDLKNLTLLKINGIPNLILSNKQKEWIQNLHKNGCEIYINNSLYINKKKLSNFSDYIEIEDSKYSKAIKDIENPNFEKIRRYCNNLLSDNQADDMQKYLAENGKTYKALIYDSLEQFVEKLDGENITLVDWGCSQGIASMLVLDYIKEKQLNIKVEELFLVDNDKKSLNRAMAQIDVLNIDKSEIKAIYSKESKNLKKLDNIKSNITLNLFANDLMPVNYSQINLIENSYIICISNQNKSFVDDVYENMKKYGDFENISFRDSKIGKFQRFEKVFKKINKNIDEDEIPF